MTAKDSRISESRKTTKSIFMSWTFKQKSKYSSRYKNMTMKGFIHSKRFTSFNNILCLQRRKLISACLYGKVINENFINLCKVIEFSSFKTYFHIHQWYIK